MLDRAGVPKERWEVTRAADCRYPRQAYELTVPLAGGRIDRAALDRLAQASTSVTAPPTATRVPDEPVQLRQPPRLRAGPPAPLDISRRSQANGAPAPPVGARGVLQGDGARGVRGLRARGLTPGARAHGPADRRIARHHVVVPPGWRLGVDAGGSSSWRCSMRETDPATFEVVKNALYCAAEEMKVVLAKTAYSPLLKVAGDYSCGLFDVQRRDGGAGTGPADSSGLDAAGREGGHPGFARPSSPATCSSTTTPTSAAAICPTSTSSRRPFTRAGCSASPACAPTGRTSAAARPAPTAPPPRSTARACACRPCGSTRPASLNREVERSSSPTSARRTSAGATCAPSSPPTTAASRGWRSWRASYGAERLLAIMQEVMDYSER